MNTQILLSRLDAIIAEVEAALKQPLGQGYESHIDSLAWTKFRSAAQGFLVDLYGKDHPHFSEFTDHTKGSYAYQIKYGIGTLRAVRDEVVGGWLVRTSALIAADLFSDFVEMAQHLHNEGYKDAAAVIAGSSLEAHLRRLALARGLDTFDAKGSPKKADLLNAELHKAGEYHLNEQKQITAWLGIRNDAAHGQYGKVIEGSVQLMLDGLRHFMTIHPA